MMLSRVHEPTDDEDAIFTLNHNHATIIIGVSIRVESISNWETPFRIVGQGGASIDLTDVEFVKFMAEYLRYMVKPDTEHNQEDTSAYFHFRKKPKFDENN